MKLKPIYYEPTKTTFGLLSILLFFMFTVFLIISIGLVQAASKEKDVNTLLLAVIVLYCAYAAGFSGIVVSIIGLFKKDQKKPFIIFGLIANVGLAISLVLFTLYGSK